MKTSAVTWKLIAQKSVKAMKDDQGKRISELEKRVEMLEDKLSIYDLLATYGPLVDSVCAEATADIWTNDAQYDFDGGYLAGNDALTGLVNLDTHTEYVNRGCAHVVSLPKLVVEGDRATATGYPRVYLNDGDGWKVERASANRWELLRTDRGWRVQSRTNRLLDGSDAARTLLAHGVLETGDRNPDDRTLTP